MQRLLYIALKSLGASLSFFTELTRKGVKEALEILQAIAFKENEDLTITTNTIVFEGCFM